MGFKGNASKKYEEQAIAMFEKAGAVLESNRCEPSTATNASKPVKIFENIENSGVIKRGIGTSENIVIDAAVHENVMNKLIATDKEIVGELRQTSSQIKEMCNTIFIIPQTLEKYTEVLNQFDSSFEEFVSLTEQTAKCGQDFAAKMQEIDGSDGEQIEVDKEFILNMIEETKQAAEEQIADMEQTISDNESEASDCDDKAEEQEYIAENAMMDETIVNEDGETVTESVPDLDARAEASETATELRKKSSDLKQSNVELKQAIDELQSELEELTNWINDLVEQFQNVDEEFAQKLRLITDDIQNLNNRLQELEDKVDDDSTIFISDFSIQVGNNEVEISDVEENLILNANRLGIWLDKAHISKSPNLEQLQQEFVKHLEENNLEISSVDMFTTFDAQKWDLLKACSVAGSPNTWDKIGKQIAENYSLKNSTVWTTAYSNNPVTTLALIKSGGTLNVNGNPNIQSQATAQCFKELDKQKEEAITNRSTSTRGNNLIKNYESIEGDANEPGNGGTPYLKAYYDKDDNRTIGWGHTGGREPENVTDSITYEKAEELFKSDIKTVTDKANKIINESDLKITQQQYDAAIMYGFQHGINGTGERSLAMLLKHMDDNNSEAAKNIFTHVKRGSVGQGRGVDEWELYSNGDYYRNH